MTKRNPKTNKEEHIVPYTKEEVKFKFYYRYADDIVVLSSDKEFLRKVLIYIKLYLATIGLKVKPNYQIFPVDAPCRTSRHR